MDTTAFYKLCSLLSNNPIEIDFITNLVAESPGKNKLIPLKVDEKLSGYTYREIYDVFLNDSSINLLVFGVFSCQLGQDINKMIKKIFLQKHQRTSDDRNYMSGNREEGPDFLTESEIKSWLLPTIPVFRILNPVSNYTLVTGDILYCYGKISDLEISKYLWEKKNEQIETNRKYGKHNPEENLEEVDKHNKKVSIILSNLQKRLVRSKNLRTNSFMTSSS